MLLSVAVFLHQLHWLAPAALMFGTAPCFLMLWWPARACTAVLPRRFYRRVDDVFFSSYLRLLLFFFENCTGFEMHLYGNVEALLSTDELENAVYISNHQSTVDWILGCSLALRRGALGRCRYVVKDGLKHFPFYGFYLSQHGTIFIKRGGKFQASKAENQLRNMVQDNCPMWMVVFPEGTRFNPDIKEAIKKSRGYCGQQGIPDMQHVLCPRTKATQVCLHELADYASCVYDVTFAYNNTYNPETGQRTASPGMPDFLSGHTTKVHVYIDKIPMKDVPTEETEVTKWINDRFLRKEQLLSHFYSNEDQDKASFPGEGKLVPLTLRSTVPSFLFWGGAFAACMVFKDLRSIYWKTGAASLVVGFAWASTKS
ncbi:1-acyl-sn-glycerol-3-phosphate acyltransferase epsilon-like [Littorina saxatilis]|uniref:Phospholipid/glycerol acyltransferase domain-containing protein n=1 Tax=Littorina saxatilis TaxID=31220 RepID=A0AAN9G8Z1_9CAEN